MLFSNIDNFYLTSAELENSPSRQDGIDSETETTLRIFGAELIQTASILLGCPQAVAVTGQVIFQRFYCKKSMKEYNVRRMAAACTYLAGKLEESFKRLRDVIMVFDRVFKRTEDSSLSVLEPATKEYYQARDTVIRYERELLRAFGFILHAEHPHMYIINYIHMLGDPAGLKQLAWSISNDSLRTTLCVRFKAEVVACGAIFYGARKLQIPLPEDVPWWEVFSVKTEQLVEVVNTLHDLYSRPKARYIHVTREPLPVPKPATPEIQASEASPMQVDSGNVQGVPPPSPSDLAATGVKQEAEAVSIAQAERAVGEHQAGTSELAERDTAVAQDKGAARSGERERERERDWGRDRDRDRERERDRDRDRERDARRDRDRGREGREDERRDRERRHREREDRSRTKERGRGDRDRDRDRERAREGEDQLRERRDKRERPDGPRDRRAKPEPRDLDQEREPREGAGERPRSNERHAPRAASRDDAAGLEAGTSRDRNAAGNGGSGQARSRRITPTDRYDPGHSRDSVGWAAEPAHASDSGSSGARHAPDLQNRLLAFEDGLSRDLTEHGSASQSRSGQSSGVPDYRSGDDDGGFHQPGRSRSREPFGNQSAPRSFSSGWQPGDVPGRSVAQEEEGARGGGSRGREHVLHDPDAMSRAEQQQQPARDVTEAQDAAAHGAAAPQQQQHASRGGAAKSRGEHVRIQYTLDSTSRSDERRQQQQQHAEEQQRLPPPPAHERQPRAGAGQH